MVDVESHDAALEEILTNWLLEKRRWSSLDEPEIEHKLKTFASEQSNKQLSTNASDINKTMLANMWNMHVLRVPLMSIQYNLSLILLLNQFSLLVPTLKMQAYIAVKIMDE